MACHFMRSQERLIRLHHSIQKSVGDLQLELEPGALSEGSYAERYRVLVVDGHAFVRAGLQKILGQEAWIDEVGEAHTGALALRKIAEEPWDAVVVELKLPDVNGLEMLRTMTKDYPRMPVLVLSGLPDVIYADAAVRQGAAGFLSKREGVEDIVKAVYRLMNVGRSVGGQRSATTQRVRVKSMPKIPLGQRLSLREVQTFLGLATGRSSGAIAQSLNVSVKTISSHRARLLRKMKMTSNADIVRYAICNGLID